MFVLLLTTALSTCTWLGEVTSIFSLGCRCQTTLFFVVFLDSQIWFTFLLIAPRTMLMSHLGSGLAISPRVDLSPTHIGRMLTCCIENLGQCIAALLQKRAFLSRFWGSTNPILALHPHKVSPTKSCLFSGFKVFS